MSVTVIPLAMVLFCFSDSGLKLLGDSSQIVEGIWQEYSALIGEDNLTDLRDQLEDLLRQIKTQRKQV